VREAGAAVGGRESVRSIGRGGKNDEHSVGEDEEEEGEESKRNELDDQTGERDLGANLRKVTLSRRGSTTGGLHDEGDDVAPAAETKD
jgi:hypothetical protein